VSQQVTHEGQVDVVVDDDVHGVSPWWALIVVCFAQFMVVLDATIVNVALPTIRADLNVSDANLQWIINSYTLAFGGLLLLGGRMSDLLGRRRVFVIGTAIFSLASLANGLAWNEQSLIFFRGIQGAGAALISPAALSVIMTSFKEGPERTKALGVWSAIAAGGASVGLLLGGVMTQELSWPWIFFINVPIGIAVIVAAFRRVPESHADLGHRKFDAFGAITVTAGLMLLVYSIVGTQEHGFTSARTLTLFGASLVLLAAFLFIESRNAAPLVRLGLLRLRSLAVANLAMLSVAAGMFAFFYVATIYLQDILGFEPIKTGLAFLPFAFGIGIGAGTAQVGMKKLGVRVTGTIGLVVAGAGLGYMGYSLAADGTYLDMFWGMVAMAIGMGWTFVPFTLIATTNVADDEAGLASGVFNTSQQIGGAIGLAILSTIANNATKDYIADLGRPPQPPDFITARLEGVQPSTDFLNAAVEGFQAAIVGGVALFAIGLALHLLFIRAKDVENIDLEAPAMPHA
jgi:EmrB/QacA subfamily drug resistance transporter